MAKKKQYKLDDLDFVITVTAKHNGRIVEKTKEVPVTEYFKSIFEHVPLGNKADNITLWDVLTGKHKQKLKSIRNAYETKGIVKAYEDLEQYSVQKIIVDLRQSGKLK